MKNPDYIIKRVSSYSVFVKVLIIALLNSFVHISQPAIKRNLESSATCNQAQLAIKRNLSQSLLKYHATEQFDFLYGIYGHFAIVGFERKLWKIGEAIRNDSAASMSTSEKNKLLLSLLCRNVYSNVVFLIMVRSHNSNISQISTS